MPKIAAGVVHFQREVFPNRRELFARLSESQQPEALFITCSDSRVDPNLITQTEPGELFIVRNAGNIVPPHSNTTGGVTASIEYALGVLKVPHIVICGHSDCGAMNGALNPQALTNLPHVSAWLGYTRAASQIVLEMGKHLDDEGQLHMLIAQNVLLQLQHLRTHPHVAVALAAGRLQLHGWVYDIKHGGVTVYDEAKGAFTGVEEHYAADVAKYAGKLRGGRK
jgi:carbonic anhydrase